jgi:hypothetical protein
MMMMMMMMIMRRRRQLRSSVGKPTADPPWSAVQVIDYVYLLPNAAGRQWVRPGLHPVSDRLNRGIIIIIIISFT